MISNEQLAIQVQQGDGQALELLVTRYHGPIHAYVMRMGVEYHAASDLVQEVFIKVFRNIAKYNVQLPFQPWIYTIASNTCKDYFKKAYVQKDFPVFNHPEGTVVSPDTPESILLFNQDRERVVQALECLKEIYREVLILRYYQDLKLEEISIVMDIPIGTVKSRLFTALEHLRRMLAREEGADD
ncbi:RNA polymerase sigma-70 factor, ECF subfamily [Sporomusa malonica]|uniref:RNA polymerase sigma-70 factor, ECF subfamily n=1 Tax=Sporomusa malonica TaxID=112901 RepID=A0A1W2F2U6_9FIRM|nr:RNA polymerase sigma-70 factor, ECF subfamily [Sporomusa malonica]